jgi:hypothetical protein
MPLDAITWGRERDAGCVVFTVDHVFVYGYTENVGLETYMRVYVAVSGASSEEDERCAVAGGEFIRQWADKIIASGPYGVNERIYYVF